MRTACGLLAGVPALQPLTDAVADRVAALQQVACSFFAHAHKVGGRNLPDGQSAEAFTRNQVDRLGIGQDLAEIPWGTKHVRLPESGLVVDEASAAE